jgi:hypothetical protein
MRTPPAWAAFLLVLLALSCRDEGSPAPSAGPASAEPTAAAPAPTVSADDDEQCMTAAMSMKYAKPHKAADAPFQDCAAGVFSHCGGGPGERGHLCSIALDVANTKRVRMTKPGFCCYSGD